MIYTDKIGQQTIITVTDAFKLRLRRFAAVVLKLDKKLPTIRELEKRYNLKLVKPRGIGADLTVYSLNWMKLYAILEDEYTRQEQIATEDHYGFAKRSTQEIKALSDKYQVIVGDHDTVIPTYRLRVLKADKNDVVRYIGTIIGDHTTKQYSVNVPDWSRNVAKPVTSPSQAINIMLSYFQKA